MPVCDECYRVIATTGAMITWGGKRLWFHLSERPDGSAAAPDRDDNCLRVYERKHENDA